MLEIDALLKNLLTIFIGIVMALFLSQACLMQPNIVDV
jgi:hypothetical protein|tara:strand:- start:365 stop:478 length:114 start_codon:yes stop_codon:yes gene_type:complete